MSTDDKGAMGRREILRNAVKTSAMLSVPVIVPPAPLTNGMGPAIDGNRSIVQPATLNPIAQENSNPGDSDWQLTRVRINRGRFRSSLIEGYCSHQSISAGETLSIYVSCEPSRSFMIDIYRMGYYDGDGARKLMTAGPIDGKTQIVPDMTEAPARLRECQWEPSLEILIPDEWVSGVYLGKLTTIPDARNEPYWQSYVVFIVRDDRQADVLFQCSDNTWQAYNRWPENESLYTHPDGAHAPGVQVSFDRPYGMYTQIFEHPLSVGSGEFLLWEYPLCYWLESQGYDVTYGSNADTVDVSFITRCKAFLSVGHDEYWDLRQYNAARDAIEEGVNYLWLCGNSVFIVSPFSDSSSGLAKRVLTRAGAYGPIRADEHEAYAPIFAGLRGTAPDERDLIGARSVVPFNGGGDWTCTAPEHWIFAETGMRSGDSIPGLVGWEHHGEPDLTKPGLEVVAEGRIWAGGVREGRYTATVYPGPRDNHVFNAATIFWAQGLATPPGHIIPWSHFSRPHGPDRRVQQITHNVLRRAIEGG